MMACPCGGQTAGRLARKSGAVLSWQSCTACGRCGAWRLAVEDIRVAGGELARRAYGDDRLLAHIQNRITRAAS